MRGVRLVRSSSEPQEHIVQLRHEAPIPFTLGGRRGNIVIQSTSSRVQKGWRLVAVNDQRLGSIASDDTTDQCPSDGVVAEEVKAMLTVGKNAGDGNGKFTVTFADPLPQQKRSTLPRLPRLQVPAATKSEPEAQDVETEPRATIELPALSEPEKLPEPLEPENLPEPEKLPEPQEPEPTPAEVAVPPPGTPPREKLKTIGVLETLPPKGDLEDPQQALIQALTRPPPVKKSGPCDKCDGPHHADDCPHFKKARDDHADAWQSYGKKNAVSSDMAPEILRNARVVTQPGDGSCLFHSLAFGLGASRNAMDDGATALRAEIADFVRQHPLETIQGTPIKDWVLWDSGLSVDAYAARMGTGHHWGGAIEMAVCSLVKRIQIQVFERQGHQEFKLISSFDAKFAKERVVRVVYGGRVHYDALEVHQKD